ncbi:MAG: M1 family aminopeptidase [Bacteroidota bacterium]|nr:M1 family aminopeptidase [Bacteroidota bacterium]
MKNIKYLIILLPFIQSCFLFKPSKNEKLSKQKNRTSWNANDTLADVKMHADEEEQKSKDITEVPARETDIIHMDLIMNFDWANETVIGECTLQCKPYAEWVDTLVLDARRFEVQSILYGIQDGLSEPKMMNPTTFAYPDSEQLHIYVPRDIKNINGYKTYKVYIKYKARPRETSNQKGMAISSDKGLYFVNAQNKYIDRPRQLWTQGETEHNHNWFPTIDHPNEKITQTITLTVDSTLTTLSNGSLNNSLNNGNGTRTDKWMHLLPHSPYLVMLAVGNFVKVKDSWNWVEPNSEINGVQRSKTIDVDYYMEPEFAPYAKTIFGNTPEMMTCYSDFLGVPYPWAKYGQVVVREYVSGAMENTSATLHGEFLNRIPRQWYDNNAEDVIAHELFHQWFGDLVTCKSWHHISLNESFATFGEILWHEHKKGKDAAQLKFQNNCKAGLRTDQYKNVPLIRKSYEIPEEVFDGISYPKGGAIIQMLRHELGDKSFFKGLNIYLTQNAYKNAEAHQLRLAFEEASGRDLNWYFNQWYFAPGHPKITAEIAAGSTATDFVLNVSQNGYKLNEELFPYRLPLQIGFVVNGKMEVRNVKVNSYYPNFKFQFDAMPDAVLLDPNQQLLGEFEIKQSTKTIINLLKTANTFAQKSLCLDMLAETEFELFDETEKQATVDQLLLWAQDITFLESARAISMLDRLEKADDRAKLYNSMYDLANTDSRKNVRKEALDFLSKDPTEKLIPLLQKLVFDTSYIIQSNALKLYLQLDSQRAFIAVKHLMDKENDMVEKTNILVRLAEYKFQELGNYFIAVLQTNAYKQLDELATASCIYLEWCKDKEAAANLLDILNILHDKPIKGIDSSIKEDIKELSKNTSLATVNTTEYYINQRCKELLDKWSEK